VPADRSLAAGALERFNSEPNVLALLIFVEPESAVAMTHDLIGD
jgi:hypothetical protein